MQLRTPCGMSSWPVVISDSHFPPPVAWQPSKLQFSYTNNQKFYRLLCLLSYLVASKTAQTILYILKRIQYRILFFSHIIRFLHKCLPFILI